MYSTRTNNVRICMGYIHIRLNEILKASDASKLVQQFNLKLAHLSAHRLLSIFGVRLFSCVSINEKSDVLRKFRLHSTQPLGLAKTENKKNRSIYRLHVV